MSDRLAHCISLYEPSDGNTKLLKVKNSMCMLRARCRVIVPNVLNNVWNTKKVLEA